MLQDCEWVVVESLRRRPDAFCAQQFAKSVRDDGTICNIFAGVAAPPIVADRLCELLRTEGIGPSPAALHDDPLAVLKHSAHLGPEWTERLEAALRAAEITAVPTAVPTPRNTRGHGGLPEDQPHGRSRQQPLSGRREGLPGRAPGLAEACPRDLPPEREPDPALLKPSPHFIAQAIHDLKATQGECTLVGDSVADIQSAGAAGVRSIGYADKPRKRERLTPLLGRMPSSPA